MTKVKDVKRNLVMEVTEPNITESCIFEDEDGIVWFYLDPSDVPERLRKIATLANNELLSENVPKIMMDRILLKKEGQEVADTTPQFSTIIWAVKPENFKKRYLPGLSHVHLVKSAEKYIKLMTLFALECEKVIKDITPELYEKQKILLQAQEIKIGNLWTSSIANFNGACNSHLDGANIKGANNIIYFKRKNSTGWNLHVPEYGGVVNSANDSLVYYPAYKHIHAVDMITPTEKWGYRNSLVLYPLKINYKTTKNTGEIKKGTKLPID